MDEQSVIELYAKYDNCRQVAGELGTYSEAVRRVLIKHGVKRTGNRIKQRRWPSNCRHKKYCNAMVVMLCENLGIQPREISELTGVPIVSAIEIINRRCPDAFAKQWTRIDDSVVDAIEADYADGLSTYEIGEKHGIHHTTVSKLMNKRGLVRGKGHGAAVEAANRERRERADARIIAEFGRIGSDLLDSQHRRELRMASRKRDAGVTWQALARRNGCLTCEVCGIECDPSDKSWGSSGATHPSVDHIVRIADGGEDTFDNARLVCCSCNLKLNIEAEKKAKSRHADDGRRYQGRHAPGTAQDARIGDSEHNRHRRRVAQHGATCEAVPRDDTRDCRVGSGIR